MKRLLIAAIASLFSLLVGLYIGFSVGGNQSQVSSISARTIVDRLQEQGFLVTQTVVFAEHVELKQESGNAFKDFFLGQTIDAYATMSVDMGIDLSTLQSADVIVTEHQIQIRLPRIEHRPPMLIGSVSVYSKEGIVKKLLDHDDGYNAAIAELKQQAKLHASEEHIEQQARVQAEKQLVRFLGLLQAQQEVVFIDN